MKIVWTYKCILICYSMSFNINWFVSHEYIFNQFRPTFLLMSFSVVFCSIILQCTLDQVLGPLLWACVFNLCYIWLNVTFQLNFWCVSLSCVHRGFSWAQTLSKIEAHPHFPDYAFSEISLTLERTVCFLGKHWKMAC